ncbi:MAG: aldo/keto reductase [Alphaproteobacteria bacterium]|nr:aldo/keto reductase [Alphaproteobacteria bacterium]
MGESSASRKGEIAALKTAVDLGMTVIDTAEMYANGGAETVVAEAIAGQRGKVFVVSKVLPSNASLKGTIAACERSLARLRTDMIDLYLLHWRGGTPLAETVRAFEDLQRAGKIRHWGVSNFDIDDLEELAGIATGCAANQVQYNLDSRGIEWDLLAWQQQRNMPLMAYCPLGGGDLTHSAALAPLARKHGVSPATVALAFLLSKPGVQAIPKSSRPERVAELARARDVVLDGEDLKSLDRSFPPPRRKHSLAMT